MHTILVAENAQDSVESLSQVLAPHYKVRTANSGEEALTAMSSAPQPDLVLLDVMMPGIDGYEIMRRMKADVSLSGIAVMLVSAMDGSGDEELGLLMGAVDYIGRPLNQASLLARVKVQLAAKSMNDSLARKVSSLEGQVRRQVHENILLQSVAGNILGSLAESGNPGTGKHLRRMQGYVAAICEDLTAHPDFADTLTQTGVQLLVKAVPMYDIGMLLVPSELLRKSGQLAPEDWETIRGHCRLGGEAIGRALTASSQPLPFLKFARDCALTHHERWDGSGYPQGLKGEKIPIAGRVVGLADSFDAMIGKRPFQEAFDIIFQGRGRLFDPDVVDAFLAQFDAIQAVADREADTAEETKARMARLGRAPVL